MAAPLDTLHTPPPVAAHPWDSAAEGWDRHGAMLNGWLHAATAALLDAVSLAPGARVLDIAAGAGGQTQDILPRIQPGGQVLATDISPAILQRAAARLQALGAAGAAGAVGAAGAGSGVATRVADAQALGLDGAHFDAAVCRLGLMLCPQPLAALRSAHAALRPGGHFGALVFSAPAANPCITTLAATALRHAGRAAPAPFEPGSLLSLGQPGLLATLLAEAGFEQISVQAIAAPMHLPSAQHYIDFVRSAGLPIMAILAPLLAAAQAAAWHDIAQQLARFNIAGGWSGPNELLLCAARRPAVANTRGDLPPAGM